MTGPNLNDPVTRLRGVGEQQAHKFAKLNITTVQDILFHLPLRYQDRTRVVPIGSLRVGDEAVVDAEVQLTEVVFRKRRSLLCRVADGTGTLTLRFFYFSQAQKEGLARGTRLRCFGEVRLGPGGLEIIHPEYQRIKTGMVPVAETLTPIYPATEGIQQIKLRQVTEQALGYLENAAALPDWLPSTLLENLHFPPLADSLRYVHRPPPDAPIQALMEGRHPAQQRLAFEELLAHQLVMRQLRSQVRQEAAPAVQTQGRLRRECMQSLPFQLTGAQLRVIDEVIGDMKQPRPMLRLVQGDVGSGKTLVAVMAALEVVEAGYQVALMAPTELLAEQHRRNVESLLSPLKLKVGWLAGKVKGRQRKATLDALSSGEINVVIGTHALFQNDVDFSRLALLIVDEQHRFGVHQRMALREKGVHQPGQARQIHPHQITMTATPIPRTLAMTAYADLDYSVIDELPPGRTPVKTVVISEQRRTEVVARIEKACRNGNQAYWVCTLIEESEVLQCRTAEETTAALTAALPALKVGMVHGRLKPAEKEQIMLQFSAGQIDLLVATTVIEVGVDVPNATLMIIENAERLGLAQLHQLRGRVGRGRKNSSCVLMYKAPLSIKARQRLDIMRKYNDGFEIAKKDLEIRGPGELLGTRQTGLMAFHIADIVRDADLLPRVQEAAALLYRDYPQTVQPIIDRWLGARQQFHRV
ncbi:MAG TPA: ATP-dependent DNA helicase RecG [Gammaproteobacteria bacterium]